MCSVIVPMHEIIDRYGGQMLNFVASATISEVEDRFTDVLKLLSLSRECTSCQCLCNLGKSQKIPALVCFDNGS